MTGANTFSLDTNTYLTSAALTGYLDKSTYDPANGARQVAFLDQLPTGLVENTLANILLMTPTAGLEAYATDTKEQRSVWNGEPRCFAWPRFCKF